MTVESVEQSTPTSNFLPSHSSESYREHLLSLLRETSKFSQFYYKNNNVKFTARAKQRQITCVKITSFSPKYARLVSYLKSIASILHTLEENSLLPYHFPKGEVGFLYHFSHKISLNNEALGPT